MPAKLHAGAASIDWTPDHSFHLAGYPHTQRLSTGVSDPLLASALCLADRASTVALASVDILFLTHAMVRRIRHRLEKALGLPGDRILLAATHTHSGPKVVNPFPMRGDPAPPVDPAIVQQCEDAVVQAVCDAHAAMVDAEAACVVADATGVGTNRRDPAGPHNPEAPLLVVRRADDHQPLAAMVVCSMHPTVLHEDSTLVTGDFPAYARQYLQKHWLGSQTPVLYFTGAAGNQSPRHVTRANTFAEARRLGEMLGQRLVHAADRLSWQSQLPLTCRRTEVTLPARTLPSPAEAEHRLATTAEHLDKLRRQGAPRAQVRTAEVDCFGAERTQAMVNAAAQGLVAAAIAERTPTEIQQITVGPWTFVAWPGEVFVEFALAIKAQHPDVHVITYANGENLGYLVTAEAVAEGGYEAAHALFASPDSGDMLVRATLTLLGEKDS